MGSNSSKSGGAALESSSSSSSSSRVRRARSRGSRIFQTSCLRSPHISIDDVHQNKGCSGYGPRNNETEQESKQVKSEGYRNFKVEQSDEMPCVTSDAELDEWGQASLTNTISKTDSSSSHSYSTRSLNSSGGFLSRFGFLPGNVSFRLRRTTSVGSSRGAHPLSSTNFSIPNNDEELYQHTGAVNGFIRSEAQLGRDLLCPGLINSSPISHHEGTSGNLQVNFPAPVFSDVLQADRRISTQDMVSDNGYTGIGIHSPRNHTAIQSIEARLADRQIGARQPEERNVRFSRTRSVGRLHDRVLRRTSFSVLSCPKQQEREDRVAGHGGGRQAWSRGASESGSNGNASISSASSSYAPSTISSSFYNSQDHETTRSSETRQHDRLEHRSHFFERRRRIRSQVRALQRLGSRFENFFRHERSCVLFGNHQNGVMGHCSCHVSARGANQNDDTSARASISRIVMLAEALFEVLDEIHQQSVVLSSAIGSVPAPTEVVESLPVKSFTTVPKHQVEDAAQCYICLVEYEEGDSMRMLPCHHEFHRICIDKWLKEIHRVCPLCRGDICRSDSLAK